MIADMRAIGPLLLVLLVGACATNRDFLSYSRTGAADPEVRRDLAQCDYEASAFSRPGQEGSYRGPGLTLSKRQELQIACMRLRGYRVAFVRQEREGEQECAVPDHVAAADILVYCDQLWHARRRQAVDS
jgi:hypothetical protein